jgi:predicted Zn-dependent peptidase
MKHRFSAFALLLALTIIFIYSVRTTSQTQTVTEGNYTYQTVEGDPYKARIYKLSNGLTVYMTVYKDEPRIQTFIAVKAGSKFDPSDATGLAHYLEHMLFKGTDKFGTKDYAKEKIYLYKIENLFEVYRKTTDKSERKKIYHQIDSISGIASQYAIANEYDKMLSSIGATGTNAYTSVEQTVYTNNIPSNQLEKWLTIEAERFRHPVMRLFHTELEAVYEEKNRGLDNDGNKLWEALFRGLFPTHQYGTQTTIGTIEHLKNPSIKKVIEYYNTYYVPNNMAICLSGDFDMDEAIKWINEKFGAFKSKPVPEYIPPVEKPIMSPVTEQVYGPESEELFISYRFPGAGTSDADMINIISDILYNRTAGLIDLDLNQSQKVLEASAFIDDMKDYSAFILYGKPRNGQTLEDVKNLLLAEVEKLKKGDFPDWLLGAIINNRKLNDTKLLESNRRRAHAFVNAFVVGESWEKYISETERLSKITKNEIVKYANEHFSNDYVVAYKRLGEDKNVQKVEKPEITPVKVNRQDQSQFLKDIINTPAPEIKPVFVDYQKDMDRSKLKNDVPAYYVGNKENNTFNLYYVLDFGTNSDKKLGLAVSYLEYLGTSKYSPSQLKEEFYKLGCSFSVSSSEEQVYVSLSGLSENFEKGLELFEEFLSDVQPNKEALDNLVNDILKERADDKLSRDKILWDAMFSYGKYGPKSPYTNILSESELKSITPDELVSILRKLKDYPHIVMYYGPLEFSELKELLNGKHHIPETFLPAPVAEDFPELPTDNNTVYFENYKDMVQAEIVFLSKDGVYDKNKAAIISMYNEYFGSGMSGIVFQELRESKALAYAVFSSYSTPQKKENSYYVISYIGSQADKISEAMDGMLSILNDMPESELTFDAAKNSILNQIQTKRITKTAILFGYLSAQKMGLDYDIRKDIYREVPSLALADVKKFQEEYVKKRKYSMMVMGDKDKIDMKKLEKYGNVKTLNLEEIFGY